MPSRAQSTWRTRTRRQAPLRPTLCGGCSDILFEGERLHRLHPGVCHQGPSLPGEQEQGGALLRQTWACMAERLSYETRGFCEGGDYRREQHVPTVRTHHCWNPVKRQRGSCS